MYLRSKPFMNPTNAQPPSTTGFNYLVDRKAFSHKLSQFLCLAASWVSHDKDKPVHLFWLFFFSSSLPGTARSWVAWIHSVGANLLVFGFRLLSVAPGLGEKAECPAVVTLCPHGLEKLCLKGRLTPWRWGYGRGCSELERFPGFLGLGITVFKYY